MAPISSPVVLMQQSKALQNKVDFITAGTQPHPDCLFSYLRVKRLSSARLKYTGIFNLGGLFMTITRKERPKLDLFVNCRWQTILMGTIPRNQNHTSGWFSML